MVTDKLILNFDLLKFNIELVPVEYSFNGQRTINCTKKYNVIISHLTTEAYIQHPRNST